MSPKDLMRCNRSFLYTTPPQGINMQCLCHCWPLFHGTCVPTSWALPGQIHTRGKQLYIDTCICNSTLSKPWIHYNTTRSPSLGYDLQQLVFMLLWCGGFPGHHSYNKFSKSSNFAYHLCISPSLLEHIPKKTFQLIVKGFISGSTVEKDRKFGTLVKVSYHCLFCSRLCCWWRVLLNTKFQS